MNTTILKSLGVSALLAAAMYLVPSTALAGPGAITGKVTNQDGEPLEGIQVVLDCSCLTQPVYAKTSKSGVFRAPVLPAGVYSVLVAIGEEGHTVDVMLPPDGRKKVAIRVDDEAMSTTVVVKTPDIATPGVPKKRIRPDEVAPVPVGEPGDIESMGEINTDLQRGANGLRPGGAGENEVLYTVDGNSASPPGIGMGITGIVGEFVEDLSVLEGGYDAEFGGVSSTVVQTRRRGGTNTWSGVARFTFSPRLLQPRTITTTDESLRVTQNPEWKISSALFVSGPLIPERLFFSAGIAPEHTRFKLNQSFYHRVDKDGSGGFEECPYENGVNDCVDDGNYIQTKKFAEQSFDTGSTQIPWQFVLDWQAHSDHRLRLSTGGGPSMLRTTYRLPFSFDPSAFGTNPDADPLSGQSRVATGVVNDHFGTTLGNQVLVGLEYGGRFAKGKLEVDAALNYGFFSSEDAWKLDNPELEDQVAVQRQSNNGANLSRLLDEVAATDLVPGVEEACNASDLPGNACPTRRWLSGGLGQYSDVKAHRLSGLLHFTHFLPNNQLKYGAQVEHVSQRNLFRYSGHNSADFFDDCPAGTEDLGEGCWDSGAGEYVLGSTTGRVDNHRMVIINTNNPDAATSLGYGRPRIEQGSLRAIANDLGHGMRADKYEQTLSTQNYAAFVQDRWMILPNLVLSAGVRWDIQDMKDALGRRALLLWDNVGPRASLSYDWTQEGRSKLYGSYGWFFQNLPLQLNNRVFGGLSTVARNYRMRDCRDQFTQVGEEQHAKMVDGLPTEWCGDSARFTTGLSEGVVQPGLKGMYNQQFQVGYQHEVIEDLVLGFRWMHTDLGRAVEDVSTNGGFNYMIANPGAKVSQSTIDAKDRECEGLSADLDAAMASDAEDVGSIGRALQHCNFEADAYAKLNSMFDAPKRNYDAYVFSIEKRFARNWLLYASYTYSRLIGNYDGFVDPTTGAVNIGASRQYDIPEIVRNSFGPLSQNRPHRVKLDGAYTFDFKRSGALTLGTSFRFNSGYPINVKAEDERFPGESAVYLLPRGAAGRVENNYQLNVSLGYSYILPKDLELFVEARLLNVTNARAVLRVDESYTYSNAHAIAGGDLGDLKHAKETETGRTNEFFDPDIVARQGNYGVETQFQQPMSGQFTLALRF